jgi:hypothetical protein
LRGVQRSVKPTSARAPHVADGRGRLVGSLRDGADPQPSGPGPRCQQLGKLADGNPLAGGDAQRTGRGAVEQRRERGTDILHVHEVARTYSPLVSGASPPQRSA